MAERRLGTQAAAEQAERDRQYGLKERGQELDYLTNANEQEQDRAAEAGVRDYRTQRLDLDREKMEQDNAFRQAELKTTRRGRGAAPPTKAPMGYTWKDPEDPAQGLMPIKGGPADDFSPEHSAKTEGVVQGIADLEAAHADIIDPETGEIDYGLLTTMATRVPWSKGRETWSQIANALEARLRAESGAAVTESELTRLKQRFMPSPFDDESTVRSKLDRMDGYLRGALNKTDPTGRFERRGQEGAPAPADMSDEQLLELLGG